MTRLEGKALLRLRPKKKATLTAFLFIKPAKTRQKKYFDHLYQQDKLTMQTKTLSPINSDMLLTLGGQECEDAGASWENYITP